MTKHVHRECCTIKLNYNREGGGWQQKEFISSAKSQVGILQLRVFWLLRSCELPCVTLTQSPPVSEGEGVILWRWNETWYRPSSHMLIFSWMSSFLLTARLWLSQFLTQESFLAPCPTGPTAPGEGAELLLLPGQAAGWGSGAAGGTGQPRPGIGHLPGDGTGTARLCAAQDLPRCGIAVAGGDGPGGLTWGGQGWGSYGEVGRDSQGWWCFDKHSLDWRCSILGSVSVWLHLHWHMREPETILELLDNFLLRFPTQKV